MTGNARLMSVIRAPVISEKSTEAGDKQHTAVFKVLPDARKDEIRRAVEKMFEVKVAEVRVSTVHGKTVTRANKKGRQASWKKAYVRLAKGYDINFAELQ